MIIIILLSSLPFFAKGWVLYVGVTGYIFQSSYKIFQLAGPAVWWSWKKEKPALFRPWPSARLWITATALAVTLSCIGIVGILLFSDILGVDPVGIRTALDARFAVQGIQAILVVCFLSLANAALEELHFRVWLDTELSKRIGSVFGLVISAVLFGAMHAFILIGLPGIQTAVLMAVALFVGAAGACWSALYRMHAAAFPLVWLSHGLTDALLLSWGLWWLGYM